jgi:DNA-binding response OmpR family regulator
MSAPAPTARVIVADDDADIRALVAISVTKAGLDLVDKFPDGSSAWEGIQKFVPDLAVLDVSMPGLTGLQICRLIRADARLGEMRIILLSAAVDDASRQAGFDAGADEYLLKPFSPRQLIERLSILSDRIRA